MPQMKPMYWINLFMLFLLTLILMNILIFFLKKQTIKISKNKMSYSLKLNWKW